MMMKNLSIIMTLLLTKVLFLSACQNNNEQEKKLNIELNKDMLTLITTVQPYGEVVQAIAIDIGTEVNETLLSSEFFQVKFKTDIGNFERSIVAVYTNDELQITDEAKSGEYIIVELDPNDEEAGTLIYNEEEDYNIRKELNYYLHNQFVEFENGLTLEANDEAINIEKEYQQVVEEFNHHEFISSSDQRLDYYLFEPKTEEGKSYPLILFLHGNGERGDGNKMNLLGNEGAVVWARSAQQSENSAYILAPQAPLDGEEFFIWGAEPRNKSVKELVDETVALQQIDEDRIYVVGISMGAIGTWRLIENYPSFFAAAVPIAGTTNFEEINENNIAPVDQNRLNTYFNIPIWAFHAADDFVVNPDNIREIFDLSQTNDADYFNYTEYEAETISPMGHFSWVPALQNQEMIEWLFEQSK
ncbi:PHB depolymerase family esterase [Salipaludibacillus sp. CF4.18]|uniref:PHB depolymerase family esterase n=1 Tax=Salipaludibacillus sp. CF4.18 TaxID=3373081 RepID=UPI003EE5A280